MMFEFIRDTMITQYKENTLNCSGWYLLVIYRYGGLGEDLSTNAARTIIFVMWLIPHGPMGDVYYVHSSFHDTSHGQCDTVIKIPRTNWMAHIPSVIWSHAWCMVVCKKILLGLGRYPGPVSISDMTVRSCEVSKPRYWYFMVTTTLMYLGAMFHCTYDDRHFLEYQRNSKYHIACCHGLSICSTFWHIYYKWQLVCKFDIVENGFPL